MQKTVVCVCPRCGKTESVTADDSEKWIKEKSNVLDIIASFKSELVHAVYKYEHDHWVEHCKED